MRIRLTQVFAGPGQFIAAGVETVVDEAFGRQLVASGHAVSLEIESRRAPAVPVVETATNNPPRPERQGRKPRAQ